MKFNYRRWKNVIGTTIILVVFIAIQLVHRFVYGFGTFNVSANAHCICNDERDLKYSVHDIGEFSKYCEYCGVDLSTVDGYIIINQSYCEECDSYTWDNKFHSRCGNPVVSMDYVLASDIGFNNIREYIVWVNVTSIGIGFLLYSAIFWLAEMARLIIDWRAYLSKLDKEAPEPILK